MQMNIILPTEEVIRSKPDPSISAEAASDKLMGIFISNPLANVSLENENGGYTFIHNDLLRQSIIRFVD